MKGLTIGYDKEIADPKSEVTRRLNLYAKKMKGEIFSVIHTWPGSRSVTNGRVHFFPTNSKHYFTYPFDSYRVCKKVIKKYKPDLIACQDAHLNGLVAYFLKKKLGVKLCMHFHADVIDNPYWLSEKWMHRIFNWISYFTIKRADGFRVVSTKIKNTLVKRGIDPVKITVVSTPIDLSDLFKKSIRDINALKKKHNLNNKLHILFDGRLVEQKNLFMLLDAFNELNNPDVTLILAGEGHLEPQLKAYVNRVGIQNVNFTGRLEGKQLKAAYYLADVVAIPSWYEGTAKTLKKACAVGTPCVTTDVSGTRDVIKPDAGIIVPIDNQKKFTAGLKKLLDNKYLRADMGKKARAGIKKAETQEKNMLKVIDVWRRVAQSK